MIFVASEAQWEEKLVNWQHFANEAAFYILCLGLMVFSGVLTKSGQSQAFGTILIALVVVLVCLNVAYIVYDLIVFIRLLLCRYGLIMKRKLRLDLIIKKKASKKIKNNRISPEK